MTVLLNNEFVDEADAVVPVSDAGLLYGYGVYETLRTFNGRLKLLDKHLKRLKASADSLAIPLPIPIQEMQARLIELIERRQIEDPRADFRVRITITAGSRDIRGKNEGVPVWFVTAKNLVPKTAKLITMQSFQMVRQQPITKSTAMLPAILGQQYASVHGAKEALLVDERGLVHEGSFCNVYVIKNGILLFPDSGTLKGVTQELLLELTDKLLSAKPTSLALNDFYEADEVFTSGSVRGVVAVSKIDGHAIQAPGPFTQKIQKLYQDWCES